MKRSDLYTILLVSNAQDHIKSITAALRTAGNDLLHASNANAALKQASEQKPDLIIIDSHIDGAGETLHARLRASSQTSSTPILILTPRAVVDTTDRLNGYSLDDFLQCPYNDLVLVARVTRLLVSHQSQQALKQSERRDRHLFDNANDIVYTHDLQGRYTYLNKKGRELTGYTDAEAAKIDFARIASTKDVTLARRMFQQKLVRGTTESTVYEISILTKDGCSLPLELNTQLTFEDGKAVGVLGIARDITKRKEDEEALRLANESLKNANHRADDEYQKLLQRVSALAQMLGAARDLSTIFGGLLEFSKVSIPCNTVVMTFYDPERNEATPQFVWADETLTELKDAQPVVIQTGPAGLALVSKAVIISNNLTSESIHKNSTSLNPLQNGDHPRLSIMTIPMTTMERVVGILEVQTTEPDAYTEDQKTPIATAANLAANAIENIRLIARDRERENQLRQSQKMEALGRLAGGVAHDFNNIITAIYGSCDVMMKSLEPGNNLRQHLADIKDCGKRAELLSRQLLGFSRKQVLQPVTLDLNTVISDFSKLISMLIGDDISVDYNLDDQLPLVHLDKNQIEQILMNLAVNSRDAMPRGGRITIATQVIQPQNRQPNNRKTKNGQSEILLTFSDTGTGIDAETQKHIFEPFYTTKEEGKGTGLGLSMVYGSVKQAGGNISVASQPAKGTTFSIRFPPAKGNTERVHQPLADQIENHRGSHTILVAEDDHRVRSAVRNALESSGYFVLEASDGREALELVQETPSLINLIISDLLMPEMNGKDLAFRVKTIAPECRILFMSGYPSDTITQEGILQNGISFIHKPFNHNDILRKVRDVLQTPKTSQLGT